MGWWLPDVHVRVHACKSPQDQTLEGIPKLAIQLQKESQVIQMVHHVLGCSLYILYLNMFIPFYVLKLPVLL